LWHDLGGEGFHALVIDLPGRREHEMLDTMVYQFLNPLNAFFRSARDRETLNQVRVDEFGFDSFFHGLHDVKASHEFLDAIEFFGGYRLQGEPEIMMGSIGNAITDDFPRLVAVIADTKHSGGNESDVTFAATCFDSSFADFLSRPI
jgi:hypothetical protein